MVLSASLEYRRRAERTIADPQTLLQEVERTGERGYATEVMEFSEDLNSVAAPIFDYRGQIVATISISGPAMRLTEERMESLVDPLLETAGRISRKLGQGSE